MADFTRTLTPPSRARRALLAGACATLVALSSGWLAGPARADGDPASDVLVTQALFLPQDAGVQPAQQAQLLALLTAARRIGYQLRVALIASPADLGSVTELWRQPENYARFLGQELSLVYGGPLLVVMPDGYGFYRPGSPLASERSVLAGERAPGSKLGGPTLAAIQRLAARSGHPIALPRATSPSNPSSTDTLPWVVLAIGAALIAVAWTLSVRARPLRRHGTKAVSS